MVGDQGLRVKSRVDRTTAPALPAGVHREVGVAGQSPVADLVGQAAVAGVALELHDRGQRPRPVGRQVQPRLDRRPAVAGEGHVEGVDQRELVVHRSQHDIQRVVVGGQRLVPEGVEARWLRGAAAVGEQVVEGHVHARHGPTLEPARAGWTASISG